MQAEDCPSHLVVKTKFVSLNAEVKIQINVVISAHIPDSPDALLVGFIMWSQVIHLAFGDHTQVNVTT